MKKLFLIFALMLAAASARAQNITGTLSTQSSTCGAGVTSSVVLMTSPGSSISSAAFAMAGTWTGTVTFYATANRGGTWSAFAVTASAGGSTTTTATANGNWSSSAGGYNGFCVAFTTASTGSVNATITLSTGGGGGGGTGTIGGTIAADQMAFGSAPNAIAGSDNLKYTLSTNQFLDISRAEFAPPALSTPAAPTVTPTGGVATTWTYKVTAMLNNSTTVVSSAGSTAVGGATLDVSHFNTITCTAVTGATSYAFYRAVAGGTPSSLGLIGTNTTCSFVDNGIVVLDPFGPTSPVTGESNSLWLHGNLSADGAFNIGDNPTTLSGLTYNHFALAPNKNFHSFVMKNRSAQYTTGLGEIYEDDLSGSNFLAGENSLVNSTSSANHNNAELFGIQGSAFHNGTGNLTGSSDIAGVAGFGVLESAASVADVFGVRGQGSVTNSGVATVVAGFNGNATNDTGTVTDLTDFRAEPNTNAGTVSRNSGMLIEDQHGIGTNNYGIYSRDQGIGANDWVFYSAGGKSQLNAGGTPGSILDLNDSGTATAQGIFSVRGVGRGDCDSFGDPCLIFLSTNSQLNTLFHIENKTAVTADSLNYTELNLLDSGQVNWITYHAGPVQTSIVSTPTGGLELSGTGAAAVTSVDRFTAPIYSTATNCSGVGSAANPSVAACTAAAAGSFSCATNASTGTCQVTTTAVTASSQIFVQEDDSLGTKLGVTCNTNNVLPATAPLLGARAGGTSFTINLGTFTVNPLCFSYFIVN